MRRLILALVLLLMFCSTQADSAFLYEACTGSDGTALNDKQPDIPTGSSVWDIDTPLVDAKVVVRSNLCTILTADSAADQIYWNPATPYGTDYYVQGACQATNNASSSVICSVIARRSDATHYYMLSLMGGADGARILRLYANDGANHTLGTYTFSSTEWAINTAYTIRIEVRNQKNGDVALRAFVNNTQAIASVNDATYKFTSAGVAGIKLKQNAGGAYTKIDDIRADGIRTRRRM